MRPHPPGNLGRPPITTDDDDDDDQDSVSRREFSRRVSERTGIKLDLVDAVLVGFLDIAADVLAAGHKVSLRGFGVLFPRTRPAQVKQKPDTGEPIQVPASVSVGWRPSPTLKRRLNKS